MTHDPGQLRVSSRQATDRMVEGNGIFAIGTVVVGYRPAGGHESVVRAQGLLSGRQRPCEERLGVAGRTLPRWNKGGGVPQFGPPWQR